MEHSTHALLGDMVNLLSNVSGVIPNVDIQRYLRSILETHGLFSATQNKALTYLYSTLSYFSDTNALWDFKSWNSCQNFFSFRYRSLVEKESRDFARRVAELCLLFDIELTKEEFEHQVSVFIATGYIGATIDQLKYATNKVFLDHFAFDYKKVDFKEKDNMLGINLLPRRLKVKINQMKGKWTKTNNVLIYTIFQGFKKGLLPVRPEKIYRNLCDHMAALGKEAAPMDEKYLDVIDRTCFDLFNDCKVIPDRISGDQYLSNKSTIESNRQQNGALGKLMREISPLETHLSHHFYGYIRLKTEVFEVSGPWIPSWEILEQASIAACESLFEEPLAAPSCILEPMKVRIITKPKWNQYLNMKDIQKTWWRHLVNNKYGFFDLVGQPVSEFIVGRLLSRQRHGTKIVSGDYSAATDNLKMEVTLRILKNISKFSELETYFMCEKALTGGKILYDFDRIFPGSEFMDALDEEDRIPMWGQDSYWKKLLPLCHVMHRMQAGVMGGTLEGGRFVLEPIWKQICAVVQKNGQLMGSIISFILLCIANLCAYRAALEDYLSRTCSLKEMAEYQPVLINGDDILFTCDDRFYEIWKDVIRSFGFEPSPGKNLYSDRFFQINSVLYKKVPLAYVQQEGDLFPMPVAGAEEIEFVNFGLITNRRKQDCENDVTMGYKFDDIHTSLLGRCKSIKKIQETLLCGLPKAIMERANRLFYNHCSWIQDSFPGLNPFRSEDQGGFGLMDVGLDEQVFRGPGRLYQLAVSHGLAQNMWAERKDRVVSILSEKMGNCFPSLKMYTDDLHDFNPITQVEEIQPIRNFWRVVEKTQRLRRNGFDFGSLVQSTFRPTYISKPEVDVRNYEAAGAAEQSFQVVWSTNPEEPEVNPIVDIYVGKVRRFFWGGFNFQSA